MNLDHWFYKAEAYGHKPLEREDKKRIPQFSLYEFFSLTFPQEVVEKWAQEKPKYEAEFAKYHYKNDKERKQVVGEFINLELAKFMEANKQHYDPTRNQK